MSNDWQPANLAPYGIDILLWVKAPEGTDVPVGQIIGQFMVSEFFDGFCEKSATGNLNTGLRQDLVTHFKLLEKGPDDDGVTPLTITTFPG